MSPAYESEPRDDHGRWTSGGSSGGSRNTGTADVPFPKLNRGLWRTGKPHIAPEQGDSLEVGPRGPLSTISDDQAAEVQQAVNDAVARNPALLDGPHALESVTFASSQVRENPMPEGDRLRTEGKYEIHADDYSQGQLARSALNGAQATTNISPVLPTAVMFNDIKDFGPTPLAASATQTPYGVMMHELGHVEFAQDGVLDDGEAAPLLESRGITAEVIADDLHSKYGASSPLEAMAEMYATAHTPGYRLSDSFGRAASYESLEASLTSQRPAYEARIEAEPNKLLGYYSRIRVPFRDSPDIPAIEAAAERNIRAGRWVSHRRRVHPSIDKLPL